MRKSNFIVTTSKFKGGITSTIECIDFEGVLNKLKAADSYGTILYAKPGGIFSGLSTISVRMFEDNFLSLGLTASAVTEYFNKSISDKYGEGAELAKKLLKPSSVIPGTIYLDKHQSSILYLGKCSYTYKCNVNKHYGYSMHGKGPHTVSKEGHMYVRIYTPRKSGSALDLSYFCNSLNYINEPACTKTKRKFFGSTGNTVKLADVSFTTNSGETFNIKIL